MIKNGMILFFWGFFLFGAVSNGNAQSFHFPEKLIIEKDQSSGLVSYYDVYPKNTLYSICKFYECTLDELRRLNPGIDFSLIEPGAKIKIPFKPALLEQKEMQPPDQQYIPVYYTTSQKDNLFRISRVYFNQTISEVMSRNHLKTHDLSPGQLILLGWKKRTILNIPDPESGIPSFSEEPSVTDSIDQETEETTDRAVFVKKLRGIMEPGIKDSTEIQIRDQRIVQQNGLAIWNKESSSSGIFALHNDAKTGTLLEVINPLLNRKTYVKVIGKIPDNTYPDNVKVILSPEAARTLGALDPRFYVRMNYITD